MFWKTYNDMISLRWFKEHLNTPESIAGFIFGLVVVFVLIYFLKKKTDWLDF